MDQEIIPGPEPRREQIGVGVDLGEVEDDENRELREIMPDDVHVLFNRIINNNNKWASKEVGPSRTVN